MVDGEDGSLGVVGVGLGSGWAGLDQCGGGEKERVKSSRWVRRGRSPGLGGG